MFWLTEQLERRLNDNQIESEVVMVIVAIIEKKKFGIVAKYRFFIRKSQHYMLGNWSEYATKKIKKDTKYYYRYLGAYIKFMFLSIRNK